MANRYENSEQPIRSEIADTTEPAVSPIEAKLAVLTPRQILFVELLSQGYKRYSIASKSETEQNEAIDIINGMLKELKLETDQGLVYLLLDQGLLQIDDKEKESAEQKIAQLDPRDQKILEGFMPDTGYEAAAKRAGLATGTIKHYMTGINRVLGTKSLAQSIRTGYAAGLRANEKNVRLKTEGKPINRKNISDFMVWMYPRLALDELNQLSDAEIVAVSELLVELANDRLARANVSTARKMRPGVRIVERWLEGESIFTIAEDRGRTDGSILFGLSGSASRLADSVESHEILEAAKVRVAEAQASLPSPASEAAPQDQETVRDVVLSIHQEYMGRVALRDLSYHGHRQLPENFEAELVTSLNVSHRPLHNSEILKIFTGDSYTAPDILNQVLKTLQDLTEKGLIFDVGNGQYSTWGQIEEADIEVTETERIPELPPQPEPKKPSHRSPESWEPAHYSDDYRTGYHRPADKRSTLQDMINNAGIIGEANDHPRKRSKKKRR